MFLRFKVMDSELLSTFFMNIEISVDSQKLIENMIINV